MTGWKNESYYVKIKSKNLEKLPPHSIPFQQFCDESAGYVCPQTKKEGDHMGIDFGKMISDAAKGVSDFVNKAGQDITKAIDQNGDGKLDISDIQEAIKKNQEAQAENQRKNDLERLKPLFPEDFEQPEFVLPRMIRVADIDKQHAENPVCKGCIGFKTVQDDLTVVTIFRDHIDDFGLSFYPELDNCVYYVDPCDRDHYVSLDEYFSFMKMKRVAELQKIAQALGAKHFKVTYKAKTESATSDSVDAAAAINAGPVKGDAKVNHSASDSSMLALSVEAEMRFPGHAPMRPELQYLKKEINVNNLIELRMDPLSPLQHQHFNIEMSNSSGIKVKDAVKIDAMLKFMKISGNTSIVHQAQTEARRILEYEIEF